MICQHCGRWAQRGQMTKGQRLDAIRRYVEGEPVKAIAWQHGVSPSTIDRMARRAGVQRGHKFRGRWLALSFDHRQDSE